MECIFDILYWNHPNYLKIVQTSSRFLGISVWKVPFVRPVVQNMLKTVTAVCTSPYWSALWKLKKKQQLAVTVCVRRDSGQDWLKWQVLMVTSKKFVHSCVRFQKYLKSHGKSSDSWEICETSWIVLKRFWLAILSIMSILFLLSLYQ